MDRDQRLSSVTWVMKLPAKKKIWRFVNRYVYHDARYRNRKICEQARTVHHGTNECLAFLVFKSAKLGYNEFNMLHVRISNIIYVIYDMMYIILYYILRCVALYYTILYYIILYYP